MTNKIKPKNATNVNSKVNVLEKSKKILLTGHGKLNKQELQTVLERVSSFGKNIGTLLLSVEMSKSHEADDCKTMHSWIKMHFEEDYNKINRYLVSARIAFNIGGSDVIGRYSDSSLGAMNKLTAEQQKKVYSKIKKEHGENPSPKVFTKEAVLLAMEHLGFIKPKKDKDENFDPVEALKKVKDSVKNKQHLAKLIAASFGQELLRKALTICKQEQ